MRPDILIVREQNGYRLLHGQLRLAGLLLAGNEATIEVKGEGTVKIVRTADGYMVRRKKQRWPLRQT